MKKFVFIFVSILAIAGCKPIDDTPFLLGTEWWASSSKFGTISLKFPLTSKCDFSPARSSDRKYLGTFPSCWGEYEIQGNEIDFKDLLTADVTLSDAYKAGDWSKCTMAEVVVIHRGYWVNGVPTSYGSTNRNSLMVSCTSYKIWMGQIKEDSEQEFELRFTFMFKDTKKYLWSN